MCGIFLKVFDLRVRKLFMVVTCCEYQNWVSQFFMLLLAGALAALCDRVGDFVPLAPVLLSPPVAAAAAVAAPVSSLLLPATVPPQNVQ